MRRTPLTYLLRAQQEGAKLLGAAATAIDPTGRLAGWRGPSASVLLESAPAPDVPAARVRGMVRHGAVAPDADAIIRDAERIAAGHWHVLGQPLELDPQAIRWDVHPVTGRVMPAIHWSRSDLSAETPGHDVKFLWELNRHGPLLRLSQAWLLTGRPEFAAVTACLLDSWIAQHRPGVGINWASALEVALRGMAWCWIRTLMADSAIWTRERDGRFRRMLWHHARFIERYDSRHFSPNTHLTGEALGLLCIGAHLPGFPRADRWRSHGSRLLLSGLRSQVLPDGFHYERSVGYHRYTLEFALHGALLSRDDGTRSALLDLTARTAEALRVLELGDGEWPALGDDDGGTTLPLSTSYPSDPCPPLAAAATLLGRPDLIPACGGDRGALGWWLGIAAEAVPSARARPASEQLASAGLLVGRGVAADGADIACLVSVGPHQGSRSGHAHSDIGHVEVFWGGHRLVADPGSPVYSGDPALRRLLRSEGAHACVDLPHAPQGEPAGPFQWRRVQMQTSWQAFDDNDAWTVLLARDLPGHSGRHVRTVILVRGVGVLVLDHLQGVSGRSFAVTWPLAQPLAPAADAPASRVTSAGVELQCTAPGAQHFRATVTTIPFARALGSSEPGSLLRYSGVAAEGQLVATLLAPARSRLSLRSNGARIDVAQTVPNDTILFSAALDPVASSPFRAWPGAVTQMSGA